MTEAVLPTLHVCLTCRAGQPLVEGADVAGQTMFNAVAQSLEKYTAQQHAADPHGAAPVALRPVACLASCDHGCAAAISAPGKWTYLLGGLAADMAADLLIYGAVYAASATGAVMPSRRPASLRHAVRGRVPSLVDTAS